MYRENIAMVLNECNAILSSVSEEDTNTFVQKVLSARSIFFVGVGRALLSAQAIAKRFAHLGLDTHYVGEITEPAIQKGDILIVCSGSGETLFPKVIAQKAKSLGAEVIMIGSNRESSIAHLADFMIRFPTNTKFKNPHEIPSQQIMTSLFEQCLLLYGDIVAKMIADQRAIDVDSLWQCHSNLE